MKSPSEKQVMLELAMPITKYRRMMFFNRFLVQNVGSHRLVHFGLVDESSIVRDLYACLITSEAIDRHKDGALTFLQRLGISGEPPQPKNWAPPHTLMQTDCATVLHFGSASIAEILLSSFAIGPAITASKNTTKPIEIEGLALLSCDLETVRLLVGALYV